MTIPEFTRGGRGKQAPYQTTHIRLPVDLKPYLEKVVNEYKIAVDSGKQKEFIIDLYNPTAKYVNEFNRITNKPVNKLSKADLLEKAEKLIKSKKGAKYCLENLLTSILEEKIEL